MAWTSGQLGYPDVNRGEIRGRYCSTVTLVLWAGSGVYKLRLYVCVCISQASPTVPRNVQTEELRARSQTKLRPSTYQGNHKRGR